MALSLCWIKIIIIKEILVQEGAT